MDLTFSVGIVSGFMERPEASHLEVVKRILRYVKGSIDCEILFPTMKNDKKCNLLEYTDTNWCEDKDDRKSIAGYIFMFGETPISWCSKKELIVALSPCETDYIAAWLCAWQVVCLKNLLKLLDSEEGDAVTLMVDNVNVINFAKNPIAHGRSKLFEMKFHYLREFVSEGRLRLKYCKSEDQVVDLLIKEISIEVVKGLKKLIDMEDMEDLN